MNSPQLFTVLEVCEVVGVAPEKIVFYLEREWILPREGSASDAAAQLSAQFDHEDLARIRLILELQRDFGANDESIPVILHLIDQLHALRHRLHRSTLTE